MQAFSEIVVALMTFIGELMMANAAFSWLKRPWEGQRK
jgi:hypothetical protein